MELKSIPLEAVLCVTNCHLPAWVKTCSTDSKFQVYAEKFAEAPFFEKLILRPGVKVYVDGVNRLQLIEGRYRKEIQFGATPVCYYGERLKKFPFLQVEQAQDALLAHKLSLYEASTVEAKAVFAKSKMSKVAKFQRNFIQRHKDVNGVLYDPENHALWPERAPGLYAILEASKTISKT